MQNDSNKTKRVVGPAKAGGRRAGRPLSIPEQATVKVLPAKSGNHFSIYTAEEHMEMFNRQQTWLVLEFRRVRRLRHTKQVLAKLRELKLRYQQVEREIKFWIARNS